MNRMGITHVYHNADPIPMGVCTGVYSESGDHSREGVTLEYSFPNPRCCAVGGCYAAGFVSMHFSLDTAWR